MEPRAKVGILGGGFGGLYAVFYQKRYIKTDVIFEYSFFLYKVRGSLYLLSPPFWYIYTVCAAAHFHPGQLRRREVVGLKTKKRVTLNEHARRQEAKFWAMMRAAEPGKRCLK